jgi:hypothetical protein
LSCIISSHFVVRLSCHVDPPIGLEDFILWVIVSLLRAVLVVGFKKLLDLGIPPIHLATIDSYREILSNYTSHC